MPTEILIADDGSGISTRDVVPPFRGGVAVPIRHIWHEDKGFRLAMIRNKAIAASRCEYIIQIDGRPDPATQLHPGSHDLRTTGLLRHRVAGHHHRNAHPQGAQRGDHLAHATDAGVRNSNNVIRIPLMAFLYRTLGPTRFVKGCNMAFWRNDLIRVNGYDESFCGWGREDSELAIRLDNSGVRQRCMKFRGVVFHLHHGKCERNSLSANEERYQQTIREHRTRCETGLARHLATTEQTRVPETEVKIAVPAGTGH